MIVVERISIEDIPVLAVSEEKLKNKPLPVLTYIHGFTSSKEFNLPFAYLMASRGYRVLLPDSLHHGERDQGISSDELQLNFWNVVKQNLEDLQKIKEEVEKRDWIKDKRFGLAGTSMGGITTSAALTQFEWIKASAVLMGSPKLTDMAHLLIRQAEESGFDLRFTAEGLNQEIKQLEAIDLSLHKEVLNERPLFFWHGDQDPVVPFEHSYSFYNEVISEYKDPEKIRFLREPGRGHKVSRFAVMETVKWFEMHL